MKPCLRIIFFSTFFILSACTPPRYGDRCLSTIKKLSQKHHLTPHVFNTKNHKIFSLRQEGNPLKLHVYIEGDGLAWHSKRRISLDPTPTEPTALTIAMEDQSNSTKVYLGRPGHYIQDKRLNLNSWTFARFSQKTIQSYGEILDQLKMLYPKADIVLYGYSGGAMIALLTAAQRHKAGKKDIKHLITFAGVLDHEAWSTFHESTPLVFSLNSLDYIEPLSQIPQIHYSGTKDSIAPLKVAKIYRKNFEKSAPIHLISVPSLTHWQGWETFWQKESTLDFKSFLKEK